MGVELGRVTTVKFENNRIYLNVKTSPSFEHRDIEFTTPATGMWSVPREGDIVEVYEVSTEVFAARFPHTPANPQMPNLAEGDFCLAMNDNTRLWLSQQEDGTVNVELEADGDVSISTTAGSGGNVTVESDGDVTVNGNSITLGNDGGAESLAVQSHTHDVTYSWGDSAGSGTATTGTPNEPGTQKTSAE
ncbi:hypothetical protein [Haloferax larsenii]|uniref:Phage baseplate assembly protein V n=1 Tax=Haloferax larsenii TaxID=302484 RepID=A0A1H7N1D8_HALLR|nr:hypothetical protein [Haloferax larsenii]SEL17320.1 hypothetical protein SAMN04488691_103163 [Haloferax larsenii]